MPFYYQWTDESQTVLYEVFEGKWTLEEYSREFKARNAVIKAQPHIVHIIGDFTTSLSPPTYLLSASRMIEGGMENNIGLIVLVQPGMLISTMIRIAEHLMPKFRQKIRYAANLEEAHTIIGQFQAARDTA